MKIDFGHTANDYSRHRRGFPDSFFDRIWDAFQPALNGDAAVLDLGTGTGTVARGLAKRIHNVTGLDPSHSLLNQAQAISQQEGVSPDFVQARAERLPFADHSFDVVLAGQCWHWFDGTQAAEAVWRVLKPDGLVLIAHFDWIPLKGNVVAATEQLIRQYNPAWDMHDGYGIYPKWLRHLGEQGFSQLECFTYDEAVLYSHDDWQGRIRASAGVGASLNTKEVAAFDEALGLTLKAHYPQNPMMVPHRISVVSGHKKTD